MPDPGDIAESKANGAEGCPPPLLLLAVPLGPGNLPTNTITVGEMAVRGS